MTTTTKASVASKKASLVPTSFGSNGKFIRYNLKLATVALKKEFPGHDEVRLTTYIGGHTYINLGSQRDDSVAPIVKTASEMKSWLAKHNLQDVTNASTFGTSRQIVGQKSKNPSKVAELQAKFDAARASIQG